MLSYARQCLKSSVEGEFIVTSVEGEFIVWAVSLFQGSIVLMKEECLNRLVSGSIEQTVICKYFDLWCYAVWHIIDICECALAGCIYVSATVVNLSKIGVQCSPNLLVIWFVPLWMTALSSWTDVKSQSGISSGRLLGPVRFVINLHKRCAWRDRKHNHNLRRWHQDIKRNH